MDIKPVKKEHRFERVLIIAGGTSLCGVDLSGTVDFDGAIITVNNVINHIPRADFWFTVDPTVQRKPQLAMLNQRFGTYYYTAQPDLEKEPHLKEWYPIVKGVHYLERIVPTDAQQYILQEEKDKITTGDSVYGALGLAYHFEAKQIILLGVDAYGHGHFYDKNDPYNGRNQKASKFKEYLNNIPKIYEQSVAQLQKRGVQVINGSPKSRVECFERVSPENALDIALKGGIL